MNDYQATPLDILVSSGQPWANAASVLGRPGDAGDVLWIETPLARRKRWSAGASVLLAAQGFTILDPIVLEERDTQDLTQLQVRVRQALSPQDGRTWHLHLNGGTKLLSSVIQEVVGNRADLHYSEPGHHHVRAFGGWESYEPGLGVRLADLLLCYGMETDRAGWATDRRRPSPAGSSLADRKAAFIEWQRGVAQDKGLPVDEQALLARWTAHDHAFRDAQSRNPETPLQKLPAWIASPEGRDWFASYRLRLRPNLVPAQLAAQHRHFWTNVRWEVTYAESHLPAAAGIPGAPEGSAGAAYEALVESRLLPLEERFAVMDRAANLRVFVPGGDALLVEMDHVWLLKSGRVLVFESKSGQWTVKDMRARIQTYKECFGSETRAILVMPPPASTDPQRVSAFKQSRENAEAMGLDCLYIPDGPEWPSDLLTAEAQLAGILG